MPLYFFSVEGGKPSPDAEGTELPDAKAAREEAVEALADMLKDIDGAFWTGAGWEMHVTDEQGAVVCTLRCSGTLGEEDGGQPSER